MARPVRSFETSSNGLITLASCAITLSSMIGMIWDKAVSFPGTNSTCLGFCPILMPNAARLVRRASSCKAIGLSNRLGFKSSTIA